MARRQYNDGMELIFQDLNAESALLEAELYERVIFQMLQRVQNAFAGDSFSVSYVGATTLGVAPGIGFQTDTTQVDPETKKRLLFLAASTNQAIAAPDTVHDRIDLMCVQHGRIITATETRNFKDAISLTISPQSFTTETDWQSALQVVTGTPANVPVAPAVPAGFIAVASAYVHAVTGLASQADITDLRVFLPIGGQIQINTTGFQRVSISTTTSLQTVLSTFDTLLKQGYLNYTDFDNLVADPAAPGASKFRLYIKSGVAYLQDPSAVITPLGSGGGGGGGAVWNGVDGTSPVSDTENGEKVWLFGYDGAGAGQKLSIFIKVPQGYISGRPITLFIGHYSPSAANTQLLTATASLVRKNLDAAGSTANQHVSVNTAVTNTVANQYRQVSLDLTDGTGKINGFNVTAGDLVRVDLVRGTDTDTADIRFVPSATEVKFS